MDSVEDDEDAPNIPNNHKERCRFCWSLITGNDIFYTISSQTKHNFEILTSMEVLIDSEQASSLICVDCNRTLKSFISFRGELIRKHIKLSRHVSKEVAQNVKHENVADVGEDENYVGAYEVEAAAEESCLFDIDDSEYLSEEPGLSSSQTDCTIQETPPVDNESIIYVMDTDTEDDTQHSNETQLEPEDDDELIQVEIQDSSPSSQRGK